MKNIEDALLRMVKAAMKAKKLMDSYVKVGLEDNELFQVYGDIAESIYKLIGEHTENFDDSVTVRALTVPGFDLEHRVRLLMIEYKRNFTQPAPHFMSRKEMFDQVKKVGGYVSPEGDWS